MNRIRSFASTDPWRCFHCLLQIILLVGFSFPMPATASPTRKAPTTHATPPNATTRSLASAKMTLLQMQTRVGLGIRTLDSLLNSPSAFDQMKSQFEEPLVAIGQTSPKEDRALFEALTSYRNRQTEDDLGSIQAFLADHPNSTWRVSLLTNLGLIYYHFGYFSKAILSWEQAWRDGKTVTEPSGKATVDRALGELMRMHARLGHAERLEALFAEIGDRHVSGPATEAVDGAKEGLWMMRNDPGIAYLCGPMALRNILIAEKTSPEHVRFLEKYRSGPQGVTLKEVGQLANKAALRHRLIFRTVKESLPVPSLVHWKVSHFAAIVGESGGLFHVEDPTFGRDLWVTRAAIDSESSGYFLVPTDALHHSHWREVSDLEASSVRGMGYTGSNDPYATTPQDPTAQGGDNSNCGMCGYAFTEMTVSLKLSDTPVGYTPPIGPDAHVTLTYNQREASQPATFSFFNLSPKWTLNWLTYIQDDPSHAGSSVSRYVAGGGSVSYSGYTSGSGTFTPETHDASVLSLVSSNPVVYQRTSPDGSSQIYSQSNGARSYPRLVFLSKVIDPAGNTLTLNYDSQMRLVALSDATGRLTTFTYGSTSSPLLVTSVTDPFGRSAHFTYDTQGRLSSITDVLGLTSQFTYDASSLINAMTTPYGKTTFSYGDNGNQRFLQATDPLGNTERLEYLQAAPGIPFSDPASLVPKGIQDPFNEYLSGRDSFYWDKHAYAVGAGVYTKARNRHWTHWAQNTSITGPTIESVKYPLENRIWMNYPGQIPDYSGLGTAISGSLDKPNHIGRVLDDGSTQLTQLSYNSFGHVTDIIDPIGRETQFIYAPNQIDLLQINQKTSASSFSPLAQFTYNNQHAPITIKDAAGALTTTAYNSSGQPTAVTNSLGQTTSYQYDNLGYLTQVVDANARTLETYTYDPFGRIASRTDSEGYTVSFSYDSFDRVVQELYPDGTTRQLTWDRLDLSSIKDRQDKVTTYTYDSARNLVATSDPLNRVTKQAYYENNLLKSLTDPLGNVTVWAIDVQGRVVGRTYANGKGDVFAFENTTSRIKSTTDALGQVKTYAYDAADETTATTYSHALNTTPNVTFTYDPFFRRVSSMTDGLGTTNYKYVSVGAPGALRLLQSISPFQNATISYQYDALSRVSSRTVDTAVESFSYDKLGRVSDHSSPLGTFNRTYLGETRQLEGRNLNGGAVATTWTYDSNNNDRRLVSISNQGAVRSYQYTTTPEYLVSQIQESAPHGSAWPAQTWTNTYDDAYRLSQSSASDGTDYSYSYDNANNTLSASGPSGANSGTYNALNQISTFGGQSFVYDAAGNVTDDGQRLYKWDAENRLLSVSIKTQPSSVVSFRYDGLGRRSAIVVSSGVASNETRYLWCGLKLCQARTVNDVVSRHYYAEGESLPLSGTQLFYAPDHLGSSRDVLSGAGIRVASYDYSPYGNPTKASGRVSTDIRYAGLFYEQNSGLYLSLSRPYDPRTGRWLSRDPVREAGGTNLYGYGSGNPLSQIDPLGLCGTNWWLVAGVAGFAVIAIVAIVATDGLATPFVVDTIEGGLAEGGETLLATEGSEGLVAEEEVTLAEGEAAPARLPQDVAVNPDPPDPLPIEDRPVGLNANQNALVQEDIANAEAEGGTDFRVNQQQVDANGERVGTNRPDLQYTDANGQRVYIEYDTPASGRGAGHASRILANDPTGRVILKVVE